MPSTLRLLAHAILALDHGRLDRLSFSARPNSSATPRSSSLVLGNVRLPVAVPHQPGLGIHAGDARAGSIEPFLADKSAAR